MIKHFKSIVLLSLILVTVTTKAQSSKIKQWKDIVLTAQRSTQADASFLIAETGEALNICALKEKEVLIDLVAYCNNNGVFSFYSPANTANITKNFRCNGASWVPAIKLKETTFRVLVPGTKIVDSIYEKYKAGKIESLDQKIFGRLEAPGRGVKFNPDEAEQNGTTFNTTSASLIWVKIAQPGGGTKNALIHVKDVTIESSVGLSSIKFDMLIED